MDEFGHTQEEMAQAVGKSRSHVANTLRLLTLPAARAGACSRMAACRPVTRAPWSAAPDARALAQVIVERGLNVRENRGTGEPGGGSAAAEPHRQPGCGSGREGASERLTSNLGLEVGIRAKGAGGLLTIRYNDLEQLDGLIRRLG